MPGLAAAVLAPVVAHEGFDLHAVLLEKGGGTWLFRIWAAVTGICDVYSRAHT